VRNTATYIGHSIESHFTVSLCIGSAVLEHGRLFPPTGTGDVGASPPALSQVVVTGVGHWRGEGLALIERIG